MTTEFLLPAAGSQGGITGGFDLYGWGNNLYGGVGNGTSVNHATLQQIGSDTNWNTFSMAANSAAAIKTNGTLWTWGTNINTGQLGLGDVINRSSPVQVGTLSDWSQVQTGAAFCIAIKTNGTLWSWGDNGAGQLGQNIASTIDRSSPVQVGALSDWAQINTTSAFALAVKTNGTLWAWGNNGQGRLGVGNVANRSSPTQVGTLSDWAQVAAGTNHSIAIKTNGTIWSWGSGSSGQLGNIDIVNIGFRSSPVQIGALSDWAQVSAGVNYTLAVKTNGTLWAWGTNSDGQLGDGTRIPKSSPVQIGSLSNWAQAQAGSDGSIALKTDGTLWAWGISNDGGLGNGEFGVGFSRSSPIQVGTLSNWSLINGSSASKIAKNTSGNLYVWGDGDNGILGLNQGPINSPVFVDSNFLSLANAEYHTIAIKANNSLWVWGFNRNGELGTNNVISQSVPTQLGTSLNWAQVSANSRYSGAIKTNGTLWMWGDNPVGVLGDNSILKRSSPTQIGTLSDWSQISIGLAFTTAIKTNNTLWTWGSNAAGQLGQNILNTIDTSSPVQVGALSDWAQVSAGNLHTLAVKTNGTLWAWGSATLGALGSNDIINRSSPIQIGALSDWSQVSAGDQFSAAIKTNGTLWTWGINTVGALGQNDTVTRSSPVQVGTLSNWAFVQAGRNATLAVKTDGSLWAWGSNNDYGIPDGTYSPFTRRSSPVQIGFVTNWNGLTDLGSEALQFGALSS